ncbi:type VII secretion protein EccB [Streptomyces sp. NPDC006324]|uniref:type VII secretion protein EccB n=1 Tax=Streptomyces sp. NPDC006324 TaxID=3156751 RepID=UPI0033B85F40
MASRRDELNAYTFAKKRTVAAFLQPSPSGTEEGAPKPLRAVLPGVIVAALVVAGFGAWGMFKPTAPKGWDDPGTRVIVGKQSTTRYVVLETGRGKDRKTLLHPVLNLASARLLLDPDKFQVIQVEDKKLDEGKPPRGPILGIPYAPDRLPPADDAGRAKRWAVCEQPGGGKGAGVQKATFLFAERDLARTEGAGRLKDGQVLYVKGQKGNAQFLVDHTGTKYPVRADSTGLLTALVGLGKEPQPVTDDWLATLKTGDEIDFPHLDGRVGDSCLPRSSSRAVRVVVPEDPFARTPPAVRAPGVHPGVYAPAGRNRSEALFPPHRGRYRGRRAVTGPGADDGAKRERGGGWISSRADRWAGSSPCGPPRRRPAAPTCRSPGSTRGRAAPSPRAWTGSPPGSPPPSGASGPPSPTWGSRPGSGPPPSAPPPCTAASPTSTPPSCTGTGP